MFDLPMGTFNKADKIVGTHENIVALYFSTIFQKLIKTLGERKPAGVSSTTVEPLTKAANPETRTAFTWNKGRPESNTS